MSTKIWPTDSYVGKCNWVGNKPLSNQHSWLDNFPFFHRKDIFQNDIFQPIDVRFPGKSIRIQSSKPGKNIPFFWVRPAISRLANPQLKKNKPQSREAHCRHRTTNRTSQGSSSPEYFPKETKFMAMSIPCFHDKQISSQSSPPAWETTPKYIWWFFWFVNLIEKNKFTGGLNQEKGTLRPTTHASGIKFHYSTHYEVKHKFKMAFFMDQNLKPLGMVGWNTVMNACGSKGLYQTSIIFVV